MFETVENEVKTRMKQLNRTDEFFGAKVCAEVVAYHNERY